MKPLTVRGRRDHLRGLKENVIMGLLIPAGTGLPRYRTMSLEVEGEKAAAEAAATAREARAAAT